MGESNGPTPSNFPPRDKALQKIVCHHDALFYSIQFFPLGGWEWYWGLSPLPFVWIWCLRKGSVVVNFHDAAVCGDLGSHIGDEPKPSSYGVALLVSDGIFRLEQRQVKQKRHSRWRKPRRKNISKKCANWFESSSVSPAQICNPNSLNSVDEKINLFHTRLQNHSQSVDTYAFPVYVSKSCKYFYQP